MRVTRACLCFPEQRKKVTPVPHAVCSGLNFDVTASDQIPLKIYEEHVNQPIKFFFFVICLSLLRSFRLKNCWPVRCSRALLLLVLCVTYASRVHVSNINQNNNNFKKRKSY